MGWADTMTGFSTPDVSGFGIHNEIVLGVSFLDLAMLFIAAMVFYVLWKWLWDTGRSRSVSRVELP